MIRRPIESEVFSSETREDIWAMIIVQAEAEQVHEEFEGRCRAEGLEATFKVRHGEPFVEILEEVRQIAPDLLITGSKALNAWGRFSSGNLPMRLRKQVDGQVSMISINETSTSQ